MSNEDHTPLSVIVVGGGFGGLTAAIECSLRGMKVTLIEKFVNSNTRGDIIDFFVNGGLVISRWDDGKVGDELLSIGCEAECLEMHKYDGKPLYNIPWFLKDEDRTRTFAAHRGKQHGIFLAYARRLGTEIILGKAVKEYVEPAGEARAGVNLEDNETLWADVVIAADGSRSLARRQVIGLNEEGQKSGWAIFRSYFKPDDRAHAHPDLKDFFRDGEDVIKAWQHDTISVLAYSWNKGQEVAWVMMHPDNDDAEESWSSNVPKSNVDAFMAPFVAEPKALLECTPPECLIDFKLVYRKPLKKWTSQGGRTILIGDAAHAHLPTSGQGGSQAIEDAVTVASCLKKCGKDVPFALEAAQRIRYNRANRFHASAVFHRDVFSKIPWDTIEENPREWALKRFLRVQDFDAAANVDESFDKVKQGILDNPNGMLDDVAIPMIPATGGTHWDLTEINRIMESE
ncbi:hypothetical protein F4779DRAFT_496812 [Xylariaceae sp. FL0662B]|nr:hypothetical protein F4779DRAFT_496812 [Xylariaceae sp. FL0662B]